MCISHNNSQDNLEEIWTFLTKSGIIDVNTEELLELIQMKKQEKKEREILTQHIENFYHIWQNDKGIYLSYLPAPSKPKGRKPITATSLEKLERKIIDHYLEQERQEQEANGKKTLFTLRELYPLFLKMKELETTATSYIRRIDSDWTAYYVDDPIIDIDIHTFTKASLKEWALTKIRKHNFTKTQYYNMSIIMRQCLDYAVDHELLSTNPFRQFKVDGKLLRKVKKPADDTQVFLTTEKPLIEAEAWKDFQEKDCTSILAIPLAFQIGVRVGELVAIKESDISEDGKYLHIQRMAQRRASQRADGSWDFSKWKVVEHIKSSAGDRYVYLTQEARRIIQVILDANQRNNFYDDGYLFVHDSKRINPRAVDSRLRRLCDHINISRKSAHKIRKSYISALIDAGININTVRGQVGHEDERTTYRSYCFNRKTSIENEADMEKALVG